MGPLAGAPGMFDPLGFDLVGAGGDPMARGVVDADEYVPPFASAPEPPISDILWKNAVGIAINNQSQEVQGKNTRFIESERPHALLISTHGYAGPQFPATGAPDTGGQVEYVNNLAIQLTRLGYKVSVVSRAFEYPADKKKQYEKRYGRREGVAFMPDTDDNARYVFVPGLVGEFIPKEKIYPELPFIAANLAQFLAEEADYCSKRPWEYVHFINSHYVDAGIVGQLLVRSWQSQIAASHIQRRFKSILPADFDRSGKKLLDNLPHHLGEMVVSAWQGDRDGATAVLRPEGVLEWVASKLSWRPERLRKALARISKQPRSLSPFIEDNDNMFRLGEILLDEAGDAAVLRRKLEDFNRHAWTPHSLGTLKLKNSLTEGLESKAPAKFLDLHFMERIALERRIIGEANSAHERSSLIFAGEMPPADPAAVLVATSQEILENLFASGASANTPKAFFPPGTHLDIYSPRSSVNDGDVSDFFEFLESTGGVPGDLVARMRDKPQGLNIIVEASRMDRTKRKDILVRAMQPLPDDTILLITGGQDGDGVYDSLVNLITELHLEERVFLLGQIPNKFMGTLVGLPHGEREDQFRLVIGGSASWMEGWGMAVQEMSAGGLPLVASELIPYAAHLARSNQAAVLVPKDGGDQVQMYADAFRGLIENPAAAREMAVKASAIAQEFGWQRLVERFNEALASYLPRRDRGFTTRMQTSTAMHSPRIYPVILAGGRGKRLEPHFSSVALPKQFRPLTDSTKTMLQHTFDRIAAAHIPPRRFYVSTGGKHVDRVQEQLPQVPAGNIMGEPEGKNTAPAIATLMYQIAQRNPYAVSAVLPVDHWISSTEVFVGAMARAARVAAETGLLVTFGVKPTWASPHYGYVCVGDELKDYEGAFAVQRFVEKPSEKDARRLVEADCFWNSGMFVWKPVEFLELFKRYQTAIHAALTAVYGKGPGDGSIPDAMLADFFGGVASISIDFALMEPAALDGHVAVVPLYTDWLDLGTPEALNALAKSGQVALPPEVIAQLARLFPDDWPDHKKPGTEGGGA